MIFYGLVFLGTNPLSKVDSHKCLPLNLLQGKETIPIAHTWDLYLESQGILVKSIGIRVRAFAHVVEVLRRSLTRTLTEQGIAFFLLFIAVTFLMISTIIHTFLWTVAKSFLEIFLDQNYLTLTCLSQLSGL